MEPPSSSAESSPPAPASGERFEEPWLADDETPTATSSPSSRRVRRRRITLRTPTADDDAKQVKQVKQEPLTTLGADLQWWLSRAFLVALVVVGLIYASYRYGRDAGYAAAKRETSTEVPLSFKDLRATPSEAARTATARLQQGLQAESLGQLDVAFDAYVEASHLVPTLSGVRYRAAQVAVRGGDLNSADNLLVIAIRAGDGLGPAYSLRALIHAHQQKFDLADQFFKVAAEAEPLNAKTFFFWGETLRKAGRLSGACDKLRAAIERNQDRDAGELFAFKLRLAQIELGRPEEFAATLAGKLAETPVAGDWLLTAAAVEMAKANFSAAAGWLEKARAVMPPAMMRERLNDPFFLERAATEEPIAAVLREIGLLR